MKATIKPLLIGLILGVAVTYLNMRELRSSSKDVPADVEQETASAHVKPATDAADPFASGEDDSSHPSSSDHLPRYDDYGLILTDPNSVQQRHLCIASWYGEYSIENFGRNTGHKFGPVWNRRNPIMILEEQLEFMKKFMAETDRLEMEQFPQYSDAVKRRLLRQSATDPRDKALIDWRDYFDDGNDDKSPVVWYGKSMKTKRWLAYADDKGVYEPDEALLKRIVNSEEPKSANSADPFSPSQK